MTQSFCELEKLGSQRPRMTWLWICYTGDQVPEGLEYRVDFSRAVIPNTRKSYDQSFENSIVVTNVSRFAPCCSFISMKTNLHASKSDENYFDSPGLYLLYV